MNSLPPQIETPEAEACPKRSKATSLTAGEASCLLSEVFGSQSAEPPPLPSLGEAAPVANAIPPPLPASDQVSAAEAASPPPLPQPRRIGRYELGAIIAKGGQGVIYRANDTELNRPVVLKMMHLGSWASEDDRTRFRTEAQAAANLQHPNIVTIHELGEHDGSLFIAMDYCEGGNLQALVERRVWERRLIEPAEAAELVKSLAVAIQYAHEQSIVHRDLKPSNVLVDAQDQPRITDFGLAKRLDQDSSLTLTGEVLGSPNFMAPEQAEARHGPIGPHTDVYGLGGILYYLLTRRAPFEGGSTPEVLRRVANEEPVPPRRQNTSIPRDLETICLKSLDKEPKRRYQTAQELTDDLGRFLDKVPICARPAGPGIKFLRWCQRRPAVAALLGILAVVSAFAVLATLFAIGTMAANLQQAEQNAKEQKQLRDKAEQYAKKQEELRKTAEEALTRYATLYSQSIADPAIKNFLQSSKFVPEPIAAVEGALQCDICSKRLQRIEMKTVKGAVVAKATSAGFVPSGLKNIEPLQRALGIERVSRQDMWRGIVAANLVVDWGLCENCYSELIRY